MLLSRLAAASVLALCVSVLAQTTVPGAHDRAAFDARLVEIDARAGTHKDLAGTFVQEKQSPLLLRPIVSRGHIRSRGEVMLWQTDEPETTRMRIDAQRLQIYYPNQKRVEVYPIVGRLAAMAASPLPRLTVLKKQFTLHPDDGQPLVADAGGDTLQVRLDPIDDEVAQFVGKVRVLLDASRGLVRVFEITDPDGEVTRITFEAMQTDTAFPESELALGAADDATVSRPMEPGAR